MADHNSNSGCYLQFLLHEGLCVDREHSHVTVTQSYNSEQDLCHHTQQQNQMQRIIQVMIKVFNNDKI